jgi:hypothetical protein
MDPDIGGHTSIYHRPKMVRDEDQDTFSPDYFRAMQKAFDKE